MATPIIHHRIHSHLGIASFKNALIMDNRNNWNKIIFLEQSGIIRGTHREYLSKIRVTKVIIQAEDPLLRRMDLFKALLVRMEKASFRGWDKKKSKLCFP